MKSKINDLKEENLKLKTRLAMFEKEFNKFDKTIEELSSH